MDAEVALALDLLERAAATGDPDVAERAREAVDRLFASHEPRVYRVCRKLLGDNEAARDMTQDVLLTAYRRLGEFRGDGSFFSFLYGIAKYRCMNHNRRKRDLLTDDGVLDAPDEGVGALTGLRRRERLAMLADAANTVLDDIEQEAVHLRYVCGLGQDEIGRLLGVTGRSGGRGLLVRCRRKLKAELARRTASMGLDSSYFLVTR